MKLPFFRCKSICSGGGVQNQAEKNSKNAFQPVPVQKFTFPVHGVAHIMSQQTSAIFEMSRGCRATPPTPPQIKTLSHLCCHPTVVVSTSTARSVAGRSPSENGSHYTRVSQLLAHLSCHTVPLRLPIGRNFSEMRQAHISFEIRSLNSMLLQLQNCATCASEIPQLAHGWEGETTR